jgi:mono/diheme cytochrome c family protein
MKLKIAPLAATLALCTSAGFAQESITEHGRVEYQTACSQCHGDDARGNGPLADLLQIETPDLTKLTERAGGTFPFRNTLMLIDGRDVRAHGGDMPLWGERFTALAYLDNPDAGAPDTPDLVARGRLLSLVTYLESIQE